MLPPTINNTKWIKKCRVENQNECKKLLSDEGAFIFFLHAIFLKEHGKSLIFSDHTRLTFQAPPAIEVVTPACMAAILTGGMEAAVAVEERVTAPARDTAECITTTSTIMTRQAQLYKYCPAFPVQGKETWSAHQYFKLTISGGGGLLKLGVFYNLCSLGLL